MFIEIIDLNCHEYVPFVVVFLLLGRLRPIVNFHLCIIRHLSQVAIINVLYPAMAVQYGKRLRRLNLVWSTGREEQASQAIFHMRISCI